MLLLSVVIHVMMQQLSVAEGLNCNGVSCIRDCPLGNNEPMAGNEFQANNQPWTDKIINTDICCKIKCRESCVTSFNEIVPNGGTWINPEDACTTHVCNNGIISNHTSACSGLPCSSEFHVYRNDTCCPKCDADWASFCPEAEDCDMACRYGFKYDTERGCDLCKCRKRIETSTSSTSTSATYDSTLINEENQTTRTVKFYLYFDPSDGATKKLLIGITITCLALLIICLTAIGWFFHRRVYKKVPLLSLGNSSA